MSTTTAQSSSQERMVGRLAWHTIDDLTEWPAECVVGKVCARGWLWQDGFVLDLAMARMDGWTHYALIAPPDELADEIRAAQVMDEIARREEAEAEDFRILLASAEEEAPNE